MEITYRLDKEVPVEKLLALYKAGNYNAWWTERNVRAWLDHCYLFVTAWAGDRLVGTVSVLSDKVNYAQIDDVLVHPSFRHRGIGLTMMRRVLEALRPLQLRFVQLIPIPGRESFFEQVGFKVIPDHKVMEWAQ